MPRRPRPGALEKYDNSRNPATPAEPALAPRQQQALAVLLAGGTPAKAADLLGVSTRTVQHWAARPAFRAEYNACARAMQAALRQGLLSAGAEALNAVVTLIRDPTTPAAVRAKVALEVLSLTLGQPDPGPTNPEAVALADQDEADALARRARGLALLAGLAGRRPDYDPARSR